MTRRLPRPRGFTLLELMIALALGLSVVASLLSAGMATWRAGRHADALVQMTEEATLALAVMRQQVAQAGYSAAADAGPNLARHAFPAVTGCARANFDDLQAGMLAGPTCGAASASGSDSLEVAYEASVLDGPASNGVLGGPSGREPLDCLGNGFPKTLDPAGGDFWLEDSKFYVAAGSLYCHGPGAVGGAAVAQDVEHLQVAYGFVSAGSEGGQAAYDDVAPPAGSPEWRNVVSVSLCVQVRSAIRVLEAASMATLGGFVDCAGVARPSRDGYLHRTFSTTIALQNRAH